MKLKDLKPILRSVTGNLQWAIVWDQTKKRTLDSGCSIEYAVNEYGEYRIDRITSSYDQKSGMDSLVLYIITD